MAKSKTRFVCASCGHSEPKWMGRCSNCGEWNTFSEQTAMPGKSGGSRGTQQSSPPQAVELTALETGSDVRIDSGMKELNRVLGGGIMAGSSVLVGGAPGIGKSTLMLQLARTAKTGAKVLYVAGEESSRQIKTRAARLGVEGSSILVLNNAEVETVERSLNGINPGLVIVDSIQTLISAQAGAIPGTVNQIKYCTHEIISWGREHNVPVFLVAHVTKEGTIAGPKVIEHMVDTVLYFDHSPGDLRVLRSTKNRFGSVDEIGLFLMGPGGLEEITDPESVFLVEREGSLPPGITAAPVFEGTRVLMIELQALVVPSKGSLSRVYSDGIDASRVSRIAAVMEKHLSLSFGDQDIYINVAGGLRINEVGVELPLAVALYSARTGIPVPGTIAAAGELSLAGEIMPINRLAQRIQNARNMGYADFLGPKGSRRDGSITETYKTAGDIKTAIRMMFHDR
ncbi:MAG: DNA repair protein RadA [Spirochaetales bacterium]|nr:DNA repair protein RadA [Spirochaetales bacterium]